MMIEVDIFLQLVARCLILLASPLALVLNTLVCEKCLDVVKTKDRCHFTIIYHLLYFS